MISERLNDCECDGIAEQTAQPRLSITVFLHRAPISRFRNSGNVIWAWSSAQCQALNNNTTVFVRVILNVGSQDALKLNVQQLGRSATIRSPGIYWICRVCDNRKRQYVVQSASPESRRRVQSLRGAYPERGRRVQNVCRSAGT